MSGPALPPNPSLLVLRTFSPPQFPYPLATFTHILCPLSPHHPSPYPYTTPSPTHRPPALPAPTVTILLHIVPPIVSDDDDGNDDILHPFRDHE